MVLALPWPLKFSPPGQQLPFTQEKEIWKFAPFGIPWFFHKALLLLVNRISTEPFFRVSVVQLENS